MERHYTTNIDQDNLLYTEENSSGITKREHRKNSITSINF